MISTLALALSVSLIKAAPASAAPVTFFSIKNFHTLCTDTYPQHSCASTFNVTYNDSPSYNCTVTDTQSDYFYCQNPGPEISMAAYIQEEQGQRTLKLRYQVEFPGGPAKNTFGAKVLGEPQEPDFSVVAEE